MKSASQDEIRSTVYHLGMRYVQAAMIARKNGDNQTAEKYVEKFKTLCDFCQGGGLKSVPELHGQEISDEIERLQKDRLVVASKVPIVVKSKDAESLKKIHESIDVINRSCQVYSKCLELNLIPPPLEKQKIQILTEVTNEEVPLSVVRMSVTSIGGISKKNITYSIMYTTNKDEEPKETSVVPCGATNQVIDLNILRRGNEKYMSKLAAKKSLHLELIMHDKGIFGTKKTAVGVINVPFSVLAKQHTVSKTYLLDPTDDTPKGEQFSLALTFKVNSPLISAAYGYSTIEFSSIKKGSAVQHYTKPEIKSKEEKPKPKANPPAQNVQPAKKDVQPAKKDVQPVKKDVQPAKKDVQPAAGKLRSMDSLPKEEITEMMKKLPKTEGIAFHVLEDWELQRWMSNNVLKYLLEETNKSIAVFKSHNVEVPPKIQHQHDVIKEKMLQNINDIKSKKLTTVQYLKKISAQVIDDEKEAKKHGLNTPCGKLLVYRAKIMREEYSTSLNARKK